MTRPAENPFRSERINGLNYRLVNTSWAALEDHFCALGKRAVIVGDHGSGKSRFLSRFADFLGSRGERVVHVRCARQSFPTVSELVGSVLFADELDSLGPWMRRRAFARARHASGFLAATHVVCRRLPVLHHCVVNPGVVGQLIRELSNEPPPADLAQLITDNHGNVRAVLRHLYDRAAADQCTRLHRDAKYA